MLCLDPHTAAAAPPSLLSFTVIAAIVTTCGTIVGLFLKDFLFVRYFDNWREKKSLLAVSKRYKDPIVLAAAELRRRIIELGKPHINIFESFTRDILFNKSERMQVNDAEDPYFLKYKIVSTLYRFCALFGWLEMSRQDTAFLNSHSKKETRKFSQILEDLSSSIADGHINEEEDWQEWKDVLIFREELRAVGEAMIKVGLDPKAIMGYGEFKLLIEEQELNEKAIWVTPVINFFTEFQAKKDFRVKRMDLLIKSLKDLIECLDSEYFS